MTDGKQFLQISLDTKKGKLPPFLTATPLLLFNIKQNLFRIFQLSLRIDKKRILLNDFPLLFEV
ncbi:hypothetical protein BRYFOR_05730 [Marvinbryantia formatexigens DSM 14469]|uniref:Uncharacterized protein n=1 Tax=Marvinbryantia formatexigens DSM 14469 TaxID=478749 RepID=C6LAT6_9FIRM|nr:hypothetical protein BRYFOR_05730 [Marvinbryantia formatexigens DSM 14469]